MEDHRQCQAEASRYAREGGRHTDVRPRHPRARDVVRGLRAHPVLWRQGEELRRHARQEDAGRQAVVQYSRGVAVVADSYWQARKAKDLLQIDWEEGENAGLNQAKIWAGLRE